jgi:hypothetical protein
LPLPATLRFAMWAGQAAPYRNSVSTILYRSLKRRFKYCLPKPVFN